MKRYELTIFIISEDEIFKIKTEADIGIFDRESNEFFSFNKDKKTGEYKKFARIDHVIDCRLIDSHIESATTKCFSLEDQQDFIDLHMRSLINKKIEKIFETASLKKVFSLLDILDRIICNSNLKPNKQ